MAGDPIGFVRDNCNDLVEVETHKARYSYDHFVDLFVTHNGVRNWAELTPDQARALRKALKKALKSIGEEP